MLTKMLALFLVLSAGLNNFAKADCCDVIMSKVDNPYESDLGAGSCLRVSYEDAMKQVHFSSLSSGQKAAIEKAIAQSGGSELYLVTASYQMGYELMLWLMDPRRCEIEKNFVIEVR